MVIPVTDKAILVRIRSKKNTLFRSFILFTSPLLYLLISFKALSTLNVVAERFIFHQRIIDMALFEIIFAIPKHLNYALTVPFRAVTVLMRFFKKRAHATQFFVVSLAHDVVPLSQRHFDLGHSP